MTLREHMKDITKNDIKTLDSGFWMTLVLLAGKMVYSLVYSGVMETVSYQSLVNCLMGASC